ncbi:MAG: hypothetical protein ACKVTZ_15390, partial [Bacteroidia bacterium]
VHDIRENKTYDVDRYIEFINNHITKEGIDIIVKQNGNIIDENTPTIVLYDMDKKAFEKNGLLFKDTTRKIEDAKVKLYQKYPNAILHTWIVNLQDSDESKSIDKYLAYTLLDTKEEGNSKHKMAVILKELFLKSYIKQKRKIVTNDYCLPCFSNERKMFSVNMDSIAYIYQNVLMYVEDNYFQFIDMEKDIAKRNQKLLSYNLSENTLNQYFSSKFKAKEEDNEEEEIDKRNAMFIIGNGLCLEIESLNEHRVMPNLERLKEIIRLRHEAQEQNQSTKTISPTGNEALQYTGLWYNEMHSLYFVGSKQGFNNIKGTQDDAYHLYQIHTHKNEIGFDISNLYEAMTVTFVRNEQYTVVPYFFDLIRLWKQG